MNILKSTAQNEAVLLIHGLGGKHITWNELIGSFHPTEYLYLGNFVINGKSASYTSKNTIIPDLVNTDVHLVFSMDFSDNQNLTFSQQGDEIDLVVEKILQEYHVNKIVLMAHSMGGLAARSYIMNYGETHISGLITVSTPHLGSYLGYLKELNQSCKILSPEIKKTLLNFLQLTLPTYRNNYCELSRFLDFIGTIFQNLNIDSKAVSYLKPDSEEMLAMYNQIFPEDLPIVNVISNWEIETFINKDILEYITISMQLLNDHYLSAAPINIFSSALQINNTDGIVSVPSQYMKLAVRNGADLRINTITTNRFHTDSNKDISAMMQSLHYVMDEENANKKISVAFLIDSSQSMEDSDPNSIRKNALSQIVQTEYDVENLFIIDFDDKAEWLNPKNFLNRDNDQLAISIQNIDDNGGTNIGYALGYTSQIFEKLEIDDNATIILLSDGKGDYSNEANWFAVRNIPIYTISFLGTTNEELLNSISLQTGGQYYKAYSPFDIIDSYFSILNSILPYSIIYSSDFEKRNNNFFTEYFYVDNSISTMNIRLFSNSTIFNFNLLQPDNTLYQNQGTDSFKSKNCIFYKIDNPLKGKWIIPDVNAFPIFQSAKLIVTARSTSNFNYRFFYDKVQDQIEIDPESELIDNQLFINNIESNIQTPNGNRITLGYNSTNRILFRPNYGSGSYKFNINVTGTNNESPFQRFFTYSVLVKNDSLIANPIILESYGNIAVIDTRGVTQNIGDLCFIYSIMPNDEILIGKGNIVNINLGSVTVEFYDLKKKLESTENYSIYFSRY